MPSAINNESSGSASSGSAAVVQARAIKARVTKSDLVVLLDDGRTIAVPLVWYPRLAEATPVERRIYELSGSGYALRWPIIDEDISVEGLLMGRRSGESAASLDRWRKEMQRRRGDANAHVEPWGEELPLPDWWDDSEATEASDATEEDE